MKSSSSYSATMPALPFAFGETRIIIGLMLKYTSRFEIREVVHENNLLNVKTDSNEKVIFNYIYNRLENFPYDLKEIILTGNPTDAKYVNLISIMSYDQLFQDFVIEVYNSCLINHEKLTDYTAMLFFENIAQYDERVASWKYQTVFKLRRLYTRVLYEAGLLKTSAGDREVCTPFISKTVLDALKKDGYQNFVKVTVNL